MIFTTNKHPKLWGYVLHDDQLAEAIVDRILERGRLLRLDGPSVRTKHLPQDDLTCEDFPADPPDRISGKKRPEFPERTGAPSLPVKEGRGGFWCAYITRSLLVCWRPRRDMGHCQPVPPKGSLARPKTRPSLRMPACTTGQISIISIDGCGNATTQAPESHTSAQSRRSTAIPWLRCWRPVGMPRVSVS
jgi:hypothetical protein